MNKFKNDRVVLLKAMRDLVSEMMELVNINPLLDQEVSEFIIDMQDKKRQRKLKLMRREVDKMIEEEKEVKKERVSA